MKKTKWCEYVPWAFVLVIENTLAYSRTPQNTRVKIFMRSAHSENPFINVQLKYFCELSHFVIDSKNFPFALKWSSLLKRE